MSIPRSLARLRPLLFASLAGLSFPLSGCATAGSGSPPRVEGAITPVDVKDIDFAPSVQRLLADGKPTPERLGLLVGVVRRQLAHARLRFDKAHPDRGTDSVIGALYLVRAGEGRGEMIDATGAQALGGAVDHLAQHGDEGRTVALLHLQAPAFAQGSRERTELEAHLAALEVWAHEPRLSQLKGTGDEERSAVGRALLEPDDAAVAEATRAVAAWLRRAEESRAMQQFSRHDGDDEIWADPGFIHTRAEETAAATIAAVFLRHGDPARAIEAVEKLASRHNAHPMLENLLRTVAKGGGSEDWLEVAEYYGKGGEDRHAAFDVEGELAAAARWGALVEAYRRDPKSLNACFFLGEALVKYGMPEAAPLVLTAAVAARSVPQTRSAGMELMLHALVDAAENEGADAARRVFDASSGLLVEADKGAAEPSSARARALMASIEVRAGNLQAAIPLLQRAVSAEPSTSGFTTLALALRQSGQVREAMAALQLAFRAPDARLALLDVADANVLAFELFRDGGNKAEAQQALDGALAAALAGRQQRADAATHARAERLLGRVLEGYGEVKGAARAFERAIAAAAADRPSLGAAMLDAIGRALVRHDLATARATLKKGLEGNVGEDDLVYGALWVAMLERELKSPTDTAVERALHVGTRSSWTAKLSAWASGKISDGDLATAAQSASQKVEAMFYTAMARRAAGDPGADQRLRAVASAPVMDLLEVQLAREIMAPRLTASLPGGVQIP